VNSYDLTGIAGSAGRPIFSPAMKSRTQSLVPSERIESSIYLIRSEKVILDHDLASLYGTVPARLHVSG
jgi:hypothetical protein